MLRFEKKFLKNNVLIATGHPIWYEKKLRKK